jgi:hypothetical protein
MERRRWIELTSVGVTALSAFVAVVFISAAVATRGSLPGTSLLTLAQLAETSGDQASQLCEFTTVCSQYHGPGGPIGNAPRSAYSCISDYPVTICCEIDCEEPLSDSCELATEEMDPMPCSGTDRYKYEWWPGQPGQLYSACGLCTTGTFGTSWLVGTCDRFPRTKSNGQQASQSCFDCPEDEGDP